MHAEFAGDFGYPHDGAVLSEHVEHCQPVQQRADGAVPRRRPRPPFYAVRVLVGTIGTKGGPVTDDTGTVLTEDGTPIPGLYAVGNAAAFWTGDAYPAPGATLGIGMTMGYLAGRHVRAGVAQ